MLQWMETPRMQWRAMGWPGYLRRMAISIGIFAGIFGVLPMVYCVFVLKPPWWQQHHSWKDIVILPAICAVTRLGFFFYPGIVRLGRGRVALKRGFQDKQWPLLQCQLRSCTNIHGVLRLEIEVPTGGKSKGTKQIVIAAPQKYALTISSLFSGAPLVAGDSKSSFGIPVSIDSGVSPALVRARSKASLKFAYGLILLGLGVYLLWLALQLVIHGHAVAHKHPVPLWLYFTSPLPGLLFIAIGVLILKRYRAMLDQE